MAEQSQTSSDPSNGPPSMPESACCRRCDYLLRGLDTRVCPECGAAFDPADASTYATSSRRQRFRRRLRMAVALLFAAGLIYAVAPRGLYHTTLAVECGQCRQVVQADRVELKPPSWIPWRYPGWSYDSSQAAGSMRACDHVWRTARITADPGRSGGSCGCGPGYVAAVNDQPVTPATRFDILTALNPLAGWRIGCVREIDVAVAEGAGGAPK